MNSLTPDTTALEQTLRTFLAHHDDARALYDAYAPDAPLFVHGHLLVEGLGQAFDGPRRPEILTPASLSRAAFERGVKASLTYMRAHAPERLLPPVRSLALETHAVDEAGRMVAWYAITLADERACFLALGLGPDGRLVWATLAKAPQPWSFEQGRTQTIADYAFAVGASFPMPRSWLDVAYYRHFGHARPPLLTLSGARFGCQSSSQCCRIGFRIELPPAAQTLLDTLPWQELAPALEGVRLPVLENGNLELKAVDHECRFLDEHRHCLIHKQLGRQPFDICARYPFHFEPTPTGVVASASPTCPSARAGLGPLLVERADDIHERLAMVPEVRPVDTFWLSEGREITWEDFSELEASLISHLDREDLPLAQRLWLGALELERRLEEPVGAASGDMALLGEILAYFDDVIGLTEPPTSWGPDIPIVDERPLASMLKGVLFSKRFSFRFGLLTAFNINVLLYGITWRVQGLAPGMPLPDVFLWRLASIALHNPRLVSFADPSEMGQRTRRLLFGPTFARIALPLTAR